MEKISIYAVGDVTPDRPNPEKLFELALPTLKQADILFGQLEANLSEKGEPQTQIPHARSMPPERVSSLTYAGFDVMSFASNHTLDRGPEALFETINALTKNNISVIGVGRNIEEARKPLILERKGTKVGFLAYASVFPKGYEAKSNKAGLAPVRVSTYYEQVDPQPGTPPQIITLANKEDMAAMVADIKKLRPLVDVLIMSIHWGVHHVPEVIAMYQKEVGHAAIDAGVDLILGHHAHILKGIEVYKGKVIFHSLCNFVMPSREGGSYGKMFYGVKDDPEYPDYTYHIDARKSIIVKCTISDNKLARVSFLPLYVNGYAQPEVMSPDDKRFHEVITYMKKVTENQGLNAKYQVEGDEVVIGT